VIGLPHSHARVVDSTNARAKALALAGAPHGTLVTADEQTAGRGRHGRSWVAPRGRALLGSVLLRDLDPDAALLPLVAALAVCEGCEAAAAVACAVKWPNDVWAGPAQRKLAGILVEARPAERWAVVGIGVNVGQHAAELPGADATSLRLETGAAPSVDGVLGAVLAALAERLAGGGDDALARLRERDALRGRTVTWDGGEGTAAGIDPSGALLVDAPGGRILLRSGEVRLALG
jgi:BirA family biotin operon repressor/biotin-[acetyl-CoA-carboxylase] ligase